MACSPPRSSSPSDPTATPAQRADAFGLLELIIAAGLIAVLCVLLFPAFKAMRERSQSVQCVANLRNYGVAALNFTASQPDNVVLAYLFWDVNASTGKETHSTKRGASSWYANLINHGVSLEASGHTCPAAEVKYKPAANGGVGHATNMSNYGWNTAIAYKEGSLLRMSTVANASRLFLCADSSATKKMEADKTGSSWNILNVTSLQELNDPDRRQNFGFRHQGRANILFLDGHIEAWLPTDIPLRTAPRTKEWLNFWAGQQ